jgi:hypothetical protein
MVVRILNKKETRLPVPELVGPQATVRPDYPSGSAQLNKFVFCFSSRRFPSCFSWEQKEQSL